MPNTKYTVFDIAEYFLLKAHADQELLSNLKLQKLVYYAQGLHLADMGTPLFEEEVRAWTYGPVIPALYHKYKSYDAAGIPPDASFDPEKIDADTREFLDEVYAAFGQFSAGRLVDLSHSDRCWKDAPIDAVITHEAMKESLKKYINVEEKTA